MKVKIGPYIKWWGPYQVCDLLQYFGLSEETCEKLGDKLTSKPFEWIHKKRKRKIKIHIDGYDVWSMDHTLSLIIHPMLIKLKENKCGGPLVDDEDVPDELKSTAVSPKEHEWDTDENWFKRWDYVLDEIIFAHQEVINEWDINFEEEKKNRDRVNNGLRLFGKYYRALWD